jgi:hypothetical protein
MNANQLALVMGHELARVHRWWDRLHAPAGAESDLPWDEVAASHQRLQLLLREALSLRAANAARLRRAAPDRFRLAQSVGDIERNLAALLPRLRDVTWKCATLMKRADPLGEARFMAALAEGAQVPAELQGLMRDVRARPHAYVGPPGDKAGIDAFAMTAVLIVAMGVLVAHRRR